MEVEFDQEKLALATEAIAMRNIIVHNRGRADERFLRATGRNDLAIRDKVTITVKDALPRGEAVREMARSIDRGLIAKFGHRIFLR